MTFGGEPLLYPEDVQKIMKTATDNNIIHRDIITNGYVTNDLKKIDSIIESLVMSGIKKIMISADAFHQEIIPLEPVLYFAERANDYKEISVSIHPAWLISNNAMNDFNKRTAEILKQFEDIGISIDEGNVIFPSGNAVKYLGEYFSVPKKLDLSVPCGTMPYTGRLDEITTIGICPNGDIDNCGWVLGNIYKENILEILDNYNPYENKYMKLLLEGSVESLLEYVEREGMEIKMDNCYSACNVCEKIRNELKSKDVA
jgi:hypothetical protein